MYRQTSCSTYQYFILSGVKYVIVEGHHILSSVHQVMDTGSLHVLAVTNAASTNTRVQSSVRTHGSLPWLPRRWSARGNPGLSHSYGSCAGSLPTSISEGSDVSTSHQDLLSVVLVTASLVNVKCYLTVVSVLWWLVLPSCKFYYSFR